MPRPPKKFTDATRSEITAEWQAWFNERQGYAKETMGLQASFLGIPPENLWPEDHGKSVGKGSWIIVVEEPSTELRDRFRIPTPSLWWARPEQARPGGFGSGAHALPGPYRVVIETPGGSLWLFPHEYVVCDEPLALITDPDVIIHSLGGGPTLDEEKAEQLFYLQQRGIAYSDALLMIMDGLDMRDWGWVEFPEEIRAFFEGVGRRVRFN